MLVVAHDLHAQHPLGIFPTLDGLIQILRSVIVIGLLNLVGFVLQQVLDALLQRLPVVFDQHGFAVEIDPFVRVDA
ncbi:hypothetical protein D3C74_302440 [compost metagenome]